MLNRKITAALCAGALALTLAGCSGGDAPKQEADKAPDAPAQELEDTVVVYSTHPEKLLTAVADDFTAETGVNVEFVNLKGELADRVRSEKGNPQADVMYGADVSVYLQLADEGCFAVSDPTWAAELPSEFKSDKGLWYGTIKTPVMMFYNSDKLDAADAPADWSDLTDPRFAGQIVARDYLSSSMRSAVCNLYYYFSQDGGDEAAVNYLTGLNANVKNYYNSGSMMFKAIGNGEASVGISTMNDIIDNRDNNGMPLAYVNATSGDVIVTDCAAVINDAPHPNAAQAFLEYVGSKDTQVMLANDFNRVPTLDSALAEAPEWMRADVKMLPADWNVIAANQKAWLDEWQNAIYSQDKTVASS